MSEKTRLDSELSKREQNISREKARALIMAGNVYVNGKKAIKAGLFVNNNDIIEVRLDKS